MEKRDLRIVFMGTPEFAVESLRSLVDGGYNVVAVVTQPDRPVGRHGSVPKASAVKEYAIVKSIPVLQPGKMRNPGFLDELKSYAADLQIVVAFRMLPDLVWDMPRFGTFNVHAALLPQYRGAAPINWAVINGETKTGITTFFLDHDIDTGKVIMREEFPIPDEADAGYVYDGLARLGAQVCLQTVDKLLAGNGKVEAIPQINDTELKPAPKIFKETCEIKWDAPAKRIYDFIRGLNPQPGAWTTLFRPSGDMGNDSVVKVFKAAKTGFAVTSAPGSIEIDHKRLMVSTRDELIEIVELQLSGKKRMLAKDFINGFKDIENYCFQA